MSLATEVVVLGGGPAGGAAARLLAAWGHRVVLLPGARADRHRRVESLPPSCRKPLAVVGVLSEVEEAGFVPTRGNSAAWAEPELRPADFSSGNGFQVERGRFDRLMVGAAASAGALVHEGAVVTGVARGDDGTARVRWRSRAGEGSVEARWVLDCTGRAGVLARRYRVPDGGPATTAIAAVWRMPPGHGLPDATHTVVESYAGGWAWSVPLDERRRYVAVMVDPDVTPVGGRPLVQAYHEEILRTRHTAALLAAAERAGGPHACSATPYAARRYGGDGFLLAGDAGSFIDPLSSYGVKKALASGWLAAVVAHTVLDRPEMTAAALQLYEERERLAHRRYSAFAADFHARAAAHHGSPFWTRRAEAARSAPPERWPDAGAGEEEAAVADRIARDPRVASAFEQIRGAPRLALRPASALRRVRRPTVRGREVVLEEHLLAPGLPAAVRYLGSVELPRLLDLAAEHEQVPELYEAYARAGGPAPLPEFLRALSALLAYGALEASQAA